MTAILQTHALVRRYGSLAAVDGLDFAVRAGARHALIGPNGAGKTTLLNLVSGVTRPTSGAVVFGGRDVTRLRPARRARLGVGRTHQHPAVWPSLTVLTNVTVAARRPWGRLDAGLPHCLSLLDRVGLAGQADRPAGTLSHGHRRQLELAVALAGQPRLLLLDEPAAGLSPAEVGLLTRILVDLPAAVTVLLVEHHLDLVYAFADTVTVLHSGRHIVTGTPEEIRSSEAAADAYAGILG